MTEQKTTRKLRAILSADVKGYSLLMADDETFTIKTLKEYRSIMSKQIEQHNGRVVDSPGDNILAEFASAVEAVTCAVEIQKVLKEKNEDFPDDKKLEFRIGVNIGDVVQDSDRIYGSGVNVAARIEGLAEPGGVCISRNAYGQIQDKLDLGYEYLGEHKVKNIKQPVRVYKVLMDAEDAGKLIGEKPKTPIGKWFLPVIIMVAIVITSIFWYFFQSIVKTEIEPASIEKMAFPLPDKPSIAVLPFDNLTGNSEDEYICDGFSDQIIASLSMVPKIFVIARNSTFTYKNRAVKVQQVAEDLGVRYVLEGSIQKEGQNVRITTQLIDAINGHHLWAETYDRELKNIFALQDEITIRIITELRVKLTDGEQTRLLFKGTDNLSVYLKYLQAWEHFQSHTKEKNASARRLLEEAIEIDPEFPHAYTLLGATYWMDIYLGSSKSPKSSLTKAFELNTKANLLNDSIPFSISHRGWLNVMAGKHDKAIEDCELAISLNPNSANAHIWMGYALRYAGRHEEAVRSSERALRLNPIPRSTYYRSLGLTYIFVGRYEEAIEAFNKAVEQSPNNLLTHFSLACVYSLTGRNEKAQEATQKVLEINPNFSLNDWAKRFSYKNQSDKDLIVGAARKAGLPE